MVSTLALTIIAICSIICTCIYLIQSIYKFILLIVSLFSKEDVDEDD